MQSKFLVVVVAALIALATMGMSAEPAEAFGERPFAKMFNANVGVIQRAWDRFDEVRSPRQFMRMLREIARAETRIVAWLRDHRATACQKPWVTLMVKRGTAASKSWRGAARDFRDLKFNAAGRKIDRGARLHLGMVNAGNRMIASCP
jgi:hypothetical protein